jgi:excisionase family DNA binding protein
MTERILLTIKEVCQVTGLGRSTVYLLMGSGELPRVRIGSSVRIHRAALEAWIERKAEEAVEEAEASRSWPRGW